MTNINNIIQEINTNLPDNNTQSITAKKLRDTLVDTVYNSVEEYDITVNTSNTKYSSLTTALGTNGANVPATVRKPGITVRFVNSTTNKYEQYRYLISSITDADFVNTSNWQGIDAVPTAGSNNLVKSGGIYEKNVQLGKDIIGNYYTLSGLIYTNGTFVSSNYYKCSDFIEYDGVSGIKIKDGFAGESVNLISFYNKSKIFISGINNATEVDLSVSDIPQGTKYFRVSTHTINGGNAQLYYVETKVLFEMLNSQDEKLNSLNKTTDEIVDDLSENQKYDLVDDGFVRYSDGVVVNSTNAKNTGMIRISRRGILKYQLKLTASGAGIAFYDKDQHYLQSISVQGASNMEGTIDLSQNIYLNAEYFILSNYDSSHLFENYDCEILFPDNTIGNRVARLEDICITNKPINILIFGDSITQAASIEISDNKTTKYYVNPDYQNSYHNKDNVLVRFCMWPYLITKYINTFDVRNYAQFGASYKDQNDVEYPRKSLSYQIEVAINDIPNENNVFPTDGDYVPDIIIFALGVNDGTPNDTFESAMAKTIMTGDNIDVDATLNNLDRTKFCEAARYAFLKIKKQFPQSLCMCILPIQRAKEDVQISSTNNELRKMAERYSLIIIDGAGQCGIIRDLEKVSALGENLKDGLHPNDKGQNLYTRMVVGAIKSHYVDMGMMNP